jgi:cytochrome c biogenesis protein CcdA
MSSPQGFNRKEIVARIGTFFLLLGIGLLVFFFLSEAAQQVTFEYFCWSLILIVLGFLFRGQFKKATPASGRFSLVRKLMPKSKQDQGKK